MVNHILGLILHDKTPVHLEEVFLEENNRKIIENIIKEHTYVEELLKYDLPVHHKFFLCGDSGCGKTMVAKAIAYALNKPIYIINLSTIVNARIGETSQNLKQIFDKSARDRAVLFLDEFDQIGKSRGSSDQDVGEMRRLVNTLIQLMDYQDEKSIIIAASNHQEVIDTALLRRFQIKINFNRPDDKLLDKYYDEILSKYDKDLQKIERKYGISFAEAKDLALLQVKQNLIKRIEEHSKL